MFSEDDQYWMNQAIELAKQAEKNNEVPVGAILVLDNQMIGEGSNCAVRTCDPTAHAEINALRQAAKTINNYRILHSTLYVTLEPCIMCIGAIIHARIKRVVFGAYDTRAGAVTSVFDLQDDKVLNHKVIYEGGLHQVECSQLLKNFFILKRSLKKDDKVE